jgi:8-hydroxy-5-deazaflavin:NADPH oxidoreductase
MKEKRAGVLGSGMVGQSIGSGLIKSGFEVMIGSRSPEKLQEWVKQNGSNASAGSFSDAAAFGDVIFLATKWQGNATKSAIELAGKKNFKNKIVVDITNPLLFTKEGSPPELDLKYPKSGGEMIQKWVPGARVVKAFNIVTSAYMASPKLQEGSPEMFICGNDIEAKAWVRLLAETWGWEVQDIGDLDQCYLLEALAMLWVRYAFINNSWTHAFKLLKR